IQLPETGRKTIVLSPYLLPSVAVCDPELTLGLPPGLTAGTGMDAFTHCVESYLSVSDNPICDGIALEGLRYVAQGLETAVGEGASHLITAAELLLSQLPLPRRLGQVEGLRRDRIAEYARLAMLDHCHKTNPRPCARADMEALFDRAW